MKQTTKTLWLMLAFVAAAISGGACDRAHLSSHYAQSYTAWFTAQHVKSKGTKAEENRKIIESLDAPEAAAVSKNYRRNVSKGEDTGGGSRLLMIGAPRTSSDGYVPPPSVPGGQ